MKEMKCYLGDNETKNIIKKLKDDEKIYKIELILYEPIKTITDFLEIINNYKLYLTNEEMLFNNKILSNLKEYIITHKIYDEVKFKSELLKIIGGNDENIN